MFNQVGERQVAYRRWLSSMLVVIAVIFVILSLWNNYQKLGPLISDLDLQLLLLGLIPCLAMVFLKCRLNYMILRNATQRKVPGFVVMTSEYAKSQLVRYIPGKVWGIMYQANRLAQLVESSLVWQAAIVQDLLANINNVVILISAMLFFGVGWQLASVAFLFLSFLLYFLIRTDVLSRLYALIVRKLFRIDGSINPWSSRESLRAVIVMHADWVAYFLLWIIILPTSITWKEAVAIGVCYSLASLFGKLAFVVPSGMFVREAAFVWLGQYANFDVEVLLLYSVVARVLLTQSDIFFAIVFLRFGRSDKTVSSTGIA